MRAQVESPARFAALELRSGKFENSDGIRNLRIERVAMTHTDVLLTVDPVVVVDGIMVTVSHTKGLAFESHTGQPDRPASRKVVDDWRQR